MELILAILGLLVGVAALPWFARKFEDGFLLRKLLQGKVPKKLTSKLGGVELLAKDRLYYHLDGPVSAVRLFGAQSVCIPVSRLTVIYEHTPFVTPPEFRELRNEILSRRIEEASNQGKILFNGPNTRLIEWRASPQSGIRAGLEEPCLELRLGPIDWFDFEGLNAAFQDSRTETGLVSWYEHYVGLSELIKNGSARGSRLSNILDNAVTIVTSDGFVGYQRRSARVSTAPYMLTSSVAENTNRFRDDTDPADALLLHNGTGNINSNTQAPAHYRPRGVPHPVAAVRRGIASEVSPSILEVVELTDIYVTGISFDLAGLHPDLLFAVFLEMPHDRVLTYFHENPGDEFFEGDLHFIPADLRDSHTRRILKESEWVPGGQASLVRALELLDSVSRSTRADFGEVFDSFRHPK